MLERGLIEQLSRGVYRLAEMPPLGNPDLVAAAARVPNGVICLTSALSYYGMTSQIPHEVMMAVSWNSPRRQPRIAYPPVRLFWFAERVFGAGVETSEVDGYPLHIYSLEKTLADCFRYRKRIGLTVALEALRLYCGGQGVKVDALMEYARICEVEPVIRPYLEALL
jgi:predicted transcriptional regulator of viral defense system